MRRKWIYMLPVAILGILLVGFIAGEAVKLLWNWLIPPIFGLGLLTYWQALGLLALCRLLFGGTGRHGSGSYRSSRSREERERFRQAIRRRFGLDAAPPRTEGSV